MQVPNFVNMDQLQTAISTRNYNETLRVCEELELLNATGEVRCSMSEVYAVQLAVYLIFNDLNSARFLWKRILLAGQKNDEINAIWNVCTALWQRNYSQFYAAIDGYSWSPLLSSIIADIKDSVRKSLLYLLGKAYTNIQLQDAVHYFGLSENDLISALVAEGWQYDENARMFIPKKQENVPRSSTGLPQLTSFTQIVLDLESY
ncbi:hypothetical protein VTP01DRAFT_3902 [Rhizomucor pusillus]|uniref:uncharacterized protein n=1 Tax=Rhizomucor pusillus TaxID=4840 RepID=UPI003742C85F